MINVQAVLTHLQELRKLTSDEPGARRHAWSPTWLLARKWFEGQLQQLPQVEHHLDAAGNHWATLPGESERAVILGCHLDATPTGSWLDGCLEVAVALETLKSLAARFNGRPPCTLRIVDWADGEGARFGQKLLGSSSFSGHGNITADRAKTDADGVTLEDALRSCGVDIDRMAEAATEQKNAAAYLELHIGEGPELEHAHSPLGVVTGTRGLERWTITFAKNDGKGDPSEACARLVLEFREIAEKNPGSDDTMSGMTAASHSPSPTHGSFETTIELQHLDPAVLATMLGEVREKSEQVAAEDRCRVTWFPVSSIAPVAFNPRLIALCDEAIRELTGTSTSLPSGLLHDAAEVARTGIPTGMMYVQAVEDQSADGNRVHLLQAAEAFGRWAEATAHLVAGDPVDLWAQEHRVPHS